jgi:hypothetical protein
MSLNPPTPTYQDSLRAIGRYFDRNIYRHVLVSEVEDGYIARAFPGKLGMLKAEGIALPLSDVMALIASQSQVRGLTVSDVKMPPLCPTGYEDFFRALGFDLDAAGARHISVIELTGGFLVAYTGKDKDGSTERAQIFYDPARIDETLTKGYQRRGRPVPRFQR